MVCVHESSFSCCSNGSTHVALFTKESSFGTLKKKKPTCAAIFHELGSPESTTRRTRDGGVEVTETFFVWPVHTPFLRQRRGGGGRGRESSSEPSGQVSHLFSVGVRNRLFFGVTELKHAFFICFNFALELPLLFNLLCSYFFCIWTRGNCIFSLQFQLCFKLTWRGFFHFLMLQSLKVNFSFFYGLHTLHPTLSSANIVLGLFIDWL